MGKIVDALNRSIQVKQKTLQSHEFLEVINQVAIEMTTSF
jgi:hypothetical protein